jgi:hypothetical protein
MKRATFAAALCAAVILARGAAGQDAAEAAEKARAAPTAAAAEAAAALAPTVAAARPGSPSLSFEAAGLAYGLYVKSPRVSAAASFPIADRLAIQVEPSAAWGGEEGSRLFELALPTLLRFELGTGLSSPYAAAGLELGWGRLPGGADVFAAGPIAETGWRFCLFRSGFYVEPYAGGAVMLASVPGGPAVVPSLFGGLRIGVYCGPWPSSRRSP